MSAVETIAATAGLLTSLLGSWFFSGTETGIYRTNTLRLKHRTAQNDPRAKTLSALLSHTRQVICTILVGNNLCVYTATMFFSLLVAHRLGLNEHWTEVVTVVFLTPVLFLFGEIYPKNLFNARADTLMYRLARPLQTLRILLFPVTALLMEAVRVLEKFTPLSEDLNVTPFSRKSLKYFFVESAREGALSPSQKLMADNILQLQQRTVADAIVPMHRVAAIEQGADAQTLRSIQMERRYARVPVYHGARNHVVGLLNLFDIEDWTIEDVTKHMKPPSYLRQNMPIDDAIHLMRRNRTPLVVVIDNHGNALGIVTVKDLVGQIVAGL